MTRTIDQTAATLDALHAGLAGTRPHRGGREQAIMMMVIRYGQARYLAGTGRYDNELVERAERRRFAALQRLVYGD